MSLKLSHLVVVIVVAALFWHFAGEKVSRVLSPPEASPTPVAAATPEPTPFVIHPPGPQDADSLYLVRGSIAKVVDDGLIIQCEPFSRPDLNGTMFDTSNAANIARAAELAGEDPDPSYGRTLQVRNNAWTYASIRPIRTAQGVILLAGAPDRERALVGKKFRAVAAETGDKYHDQYPTYILEFPMVVTSAVTPPPLFPKATNNDWMWAEKPGMDLPYAKHVRIKKIKQGP